MYVCITVSLLSIQFQDREIFAIVKFNTKFCFVFNTKHVNYASPFLLKDFSVWMRENAELHVKYLVKSYLIISNQIAKLAFDTILTVYRPTRPYFVVSSSDEVNDLIFTDSKNQQSFAMA